MRALHMIRYHWRRRRFLLLLFGLLTLVIATATLFYVKAEYATNMVVFQNGYAHVEQGYSSLDMSFNYSFLFIMLVWVTAVGILRQERSFFVTASASRWEFMLGLVGFIALFSLAATGVNWLVGVLNRLEMPLLGMKVRQGFTPGLVLTGGRPGFGGSLLLCFTRMLTAAGWACLVYALFARWWKQLLILFGAGVVVMIVLGVQVSLGAYTQSMVSAARALSDWLQYVFIPKVVPVWEQFFGETRAWVWALRDLGQFVFCYALIYPIILRLRVRN